MDYHQILDRFWYNSMTNSAEQLKTWLRESLDAFQLSQREASTRAGVAENTISMIMGGHMPREETLRALARVFNTDEDYVLYLAGKRPSYGDLDPELVALAKRLAQATPDQRKRALKAILALLEAVDIE